MNLNSAVWRRAVGDAGCRAGSCHLTRECVRLSAQETISVSGSARQLILAFACGGAEPSREMIEVDAVTQTAMTATAVRRRTRRASARRAGGRGATCDSADLRSRGWRLLPGASPPSISLRIREVERAASFNRCCSARHAHPKRTLRMLYEPRVTTVPGVDVACSCTSLLWKPGRLRGRPVPSRQQKTCGRRASSGRKHRALFRR